MSDQAAAGQICEALASPDKLQDALWARLSERRGCIEYCHNRSSAYVEDKGTLAATLFFRVGLFFGTPGDKARDVVRAISRKGGYLNWLNWRDSVGFPQIDVHGPRLEQIGFVYTARVRDCPHVLKVGFSRRPHLRMRELETKFGEAIDLVEMKVGTPIDETCAHLAAGRRYIGREFLFAEDWQDIRPSQIPAFLRQPLNQPEV